MFNELQIVGRKKEAIGQVALVGGDLLTFAPPEDYQVPSAALRRILAIMLDQADENAYREAS